MTAPPPAIRLDTPWYEVHAEALEGAYRLYACTRLADATRYARRWRTAYQRLRRSYLLDCMSVRRERARDNLRLLTPADLFDMIDQDDDATQFIETIAIRQVTALPDRPPQCKRAGRRLCVPRDMHARGGTVA